MTLFIDKKVESVAAGINFSIILTKSGEVYSFGDNVNGQLGLGLQKRVNRGPQRLEFFAEKQVTQIYAGDGHSFAVTLNGKLYGWGLNTRYQLGLKHKANQNIPQLIYIPQNLKVNTMIVGSHHQFAIIETNQMLCFGSNEFSELGLQHNGDVIEPTQFNYFNNMSIRLFAGNHCTFGINEVDEVYAWGQNGYGRLGLIHNKNVYIPQKVNYLSGKNIKQIVFTWDKTFALVRL